MKLRILSIYKDSTVIVMSLSVTLDSAFLIPTDVMAGMTVVMGVMRIIVLVST